MSTPVPVPRDPPEGGPPDPGSTGVGAPPRAEGAPPETSDGPGVVVAHALPEAGVEEDDKTQPVEKTPAKPPSETPTLEGRTSAPAPPGPSFARQRRRPWWGRGVEGPTPWSHFARAMAYEVMVVLVTAVGVAVLAFVALQGEFQDVFIKLRSSTVPSGEVALLTIGPQALYTWNPADPEPDTTPRALLAELVRFLDAAGADVVVLDFLLDRPAEGDEVLAAAARAHGAVVAAERFEVTEPSSGQRFVPGVAPALDGVITTGFANFQVEQSTLFSEEELVRRVPLVAVTDRAQLVGPWPTNLLGARQDTDAVAPSLGLLAAWLHRARRDPGLSPTALHGQLAQACQPPGPTCALDLPALGLPPIPHDLSEPLRINFRGPEHADGIPTVTAERALGVMAEAALLRTLGVEQPVQVPEDLKRVLEGRVVVVGRVDRVGTPHADRFVTPYALPLLRRADMAGPRVHAHVIDTLLSGRHIRRVGGGWSWALALVLAIAVRASHPWLRDDVFTVLWLTVAAGVAIAGVVTFDWTDGVALDIGPPLGAVLFVLVLSLLRSWSIAETAEPAPAESP